MIRLNIFQKYLDEIKQGTKTFEYRKNSPYYKERLKDWKNHFLCLSSRKEKIYCEIQSVRLVKNPFEKRPVFLNTPKIYKIAVKYLKSCPKQPF